MPKKTAFLTLLALPCVLAGCALFDGGSNPGLELAAQANPPVFDLPVPKGFKLDEGNSRSFDSGAARFVDHVYLGSASKFAVARFYKKVMVSKGWIFVNETFSLGKLSLRFEKPGERCWVFITPGSWLHPTKLELQLWTSELINRPTTDPKDRSKTR